jgi:hypothetical protein
MNLAVAAAPAMIEHALDEAVTQMQEEERRCTEVAARRELADTWLELTRRRAEWSQRFPAALREAQAKRAPERTSAGATPEVSNDRFGGLTLVDDGALLRELDGARILQLLAPRLEQPLAELDALMSSALGLETVQPEANPLRPQVFALALRDLMQGATEAAWPRIWSQHLAAPLAGEIAKLYGDALKVLRGARLTEAHYRVLPTAPTPTKAPTPSGFGTSGHGALSSGFGASGHGALSSGFGTSGHGALAAANGAAPGAPSGATTGAAQASGAQPPAAAGDAAAALGNSGSLGGASWADLSSYQLADELFQNFLFSRTPPSAQALAPAFYAKVDAQLAAIESAIESFDPYDAETVTQQRAQAPVERAPRPVATTRELDNAMWGRWAAARERAVHRSRLKKEARQVGQVLGLEVVRKLVDQVARDPRLLAPVREAIVALEPALAKLALVAPRFFAQEDHAGRRLVERVAERSFRYNDEFRSDFHEFFSDVRTTFRTLNEQPVADPEPFTRALQELEERWSGEDALEQRGSQVAVEAMHFAEARAAEAAQIAWTMNQRADLDGVPAVVQDFLFGPWSLVIAHARLTDTQRQIDPGGWNAVVADLLWSVKSEQTLRDPNRLFTTVPHMLERLRAGMKLVGQEASEHQSFFLALEKLHSPVLKLRARTRHASHVVASDVKVDAALLSTERQKPPAPSGTPWLTPSEQKAAGFDEERPSTPAPLDSVAAPLEQDDAHDAPDVGGVIAGLHQGAWVDLYAREHWLRANLKWVSGRNTLFMFVSHGGQPHTMTRRSLEKLVRERHLRPVDHGAVVPRALDALSEKHEPATASRRSVRQEEHAPA